MCNDYRNRLDLQSYRDAFSQLKVPLRFAGDAAPNLEPKEDIWPTDRAPVIRPAADGDGAELAVMRWGFPPAAPKRPPVINFRSEGRQFTTGRCLIPADGFYEFTGSKSPKSKWLFTLAGEPWFCIAGLWRPSDAGDAFTMLTMEPGPDLEGIHDRQIVVLEPRQWLAWLDPAQPAGPMLQALPAGSLERVQVR